MRESQASSSSRSAIRVLSLTFVVDALFLNRVLFLVGVVLQKKQISGIWVDTEMAKRLSSQLFQWRKIQFEFLSLVLLGDLIFIANVGDSRAVLATTSEDGSLVPVQLTVDFKPSLPQEAERIIQSNGRVFCLDDEPGVQRVWQPDGETPGLAMSRAFGDYCVKGFGLISVPEVTQRNITSRDQFVVLATDGVWDVVSNQEAVQIVGSTADRAKSAKRLVECAVHAWKRKRRGIAMDDISAICLFFHSSPLSDPQQVHPISIATPK